MAQPIKYKKPRRFNLVSVPLLAAIGLAAYFAYQYIPLFMLKQEAYRVLEETGSALYGHKSLYEKNASDREKLRRKMESQLRVLGVDDPELETWIDIESKEARVGAIYSEWVYWPFDVFPKREVVYEIEHVFSLM